MQSISRRSFAILGASATIAAAVPLRYARAAEFTFKLGTNVPDTHPLNVYARKAADEIKQATDGRFELQVFASNQLGGDTDMFSQLRSGALEFFALSGVNILSMLIPSSAIYGVGFAWKDYPTLWNALDGKLGEHLRGQINKSGLDVMEKIWDNGFRQITTSTKAIAGPADLQGVRIRVPISALWTSLFQSLGAAPGGADFAEVHAVLRGRIFDAQENSLGIIATVKLDEVQTYCSLTNHMWDGWWFLVNRRAWERLPQPIQEIVSRNINAAAIEQRRDVAALETVLRGELGAKGLGFNDVEPAPFRARLRESGFYAQWRAKFGEQAWQLLEEATGELT